MDASLYQHAAMKFRRDLVTGEQAGLTNGALGLAGEAGEVADTIKKALFHDHPLNPSALLQEMGDCLWYLALLAQTLETDLSVVMALNIQKLSERYPAGFDAERSRARYAPQDAGPFIPLLRRVGGLE